MTNQIQTVSHKDYFNAPAVQAKINEVTNGSGKQFVASLLSIVNNNRLLAKATNETIMTSAMKAAVLNLPIEPSLGFAYIVPYKGQAQFQIGYKGLIQLAIRSGQIKNINSGIIYASQFKSYDPLFENLEVDFSQPATGEVAGYFASLELTNGFRKLTYWTKDRVYNHGKRFSMSFNNGPWKSDFDAMAQKTLLKDLISKYAPLSTEMQNAIMADNESENLKAAPVDVTPAHETQSLDSLLGHVEESPAVDSETGEILGQDTEANQKVDMLEGEDF